MVVRDLVIGAFVGFGIGYLFLDVGSSNQPTQHVTKQIDTVRSRIDSAQINAAYRTKLLKDLRNENDSNFADYFANPDSFIIVPIAKFREHDTSVANGAGGM